MRTEIATPPSFWSDDDVHAWVNACAPHGVDPLHLLMCAAHESGCNPACIHQWTDPQGVVHYGAVGLIQIIPVNLSPLGFHGSPLEFSHLSVKDQCRFVDRYLGWFPAMRARGLAGVYAGLFLPALIAVADEHPDEPLCGLHGPFGEYYQPNIVFDAPDSTGHRKGYICGADLVAAAERAFNASHVAQDVARRLAPLPEPTLVSALAGSPENVPPPSPNEPSDMG